MIFLLAAAAPTAPGDDHGSTTAGEKGGGRPTSTSQPVPPNQLTGKPLAVPTRAAQMSAFLSVRGRSVSADLIWIAFLTHVQILEKLCPASRQVRIFTLGFQVLRVSRSHT